jgi:hypothetical protein
MLLKAAVGDTLISPTTALPMGEFASSDEMPFSFAADGLGLESYQGYGPYVLIRDNNVAYSTPAYEFSGDKSESWLGGTGWRQPLYDYSSGEPVFTNTAREVRFDPLRTYDSWNPQWLGGAGLPWGLTGGGGAAIKFLPRLFGSAAGPAGVTLMAIGALGYVSNSVLRFDTVLSVNVVPVNRNLPNPPQVFPVQMPGFPGH